MISVCVGQGGIQLGSACWELFCQEHGVQNDKRKSKTHSLISSSALFSETPSNEYIPRTVFADLEPSSTNAVQTSFPNLYLKDQFVSSKEDTSSNYIRGRYTIGREISNESLEKIRKLAEACDELQCISMFHSINGGTGSGVGNLLLEVLGVEYPKKPRISHAIFPSPNISSNVVEAYNAMLSIHDLINCSEICHVLDNEAAYNICNRHLDIETPNYSNINRIMSRSICSFTNYMENNHQVYFDAALAQGSLVPYPRLKFLMSSLAPLVPAEKAYHNDFSVNQITTSAFDPDSTLASCDPRQGKYLKTFMMYRGDVNENQIKQAESIINTMPTIKYVDWCPKNYNYEINNEPLCVLNDENIAKTSRFLSMMSNTTAISGIFHRIKQKYDLMYSKRAFVHWFVGEGLSEGFFGEAYENVIALQKDYDEIGLKL